MQKEILQKIPLNLDLLAAECSEEIAAEDIERARKEWQDRIEARREYMRAYMREWQLLPNNNLCCRNRLKAYRKAHREELAAKNKAYHEAHRAKRNAYNKAYREAHREEIAAYNEAHRARHNASNKAYYEAHREEINAKRRLKRAEAKAAKNKN